MELLRKIFFVTVLLFPFSLPAAAVPVKIGDGPINGACIGRHIRYLSEKDLFETISPRWNADRGAVDKIKSGRLASDRNFEVEMRDIPGGYLAVLTDRGNGKQSRISWGLDDVKNDRVRPFFRESDSDILKLSFIPHSYWLEFSINNRSGKEKELFLELDKYMFSLVNLFYTGADGPVEIRGDFVVPVSKRLVRNKNIVFRIMAVPGITVLHMRVDNWFVDTVPLRLWTPAEYHRNVTGTNMILGIIAGIYFMIILYSFIIFLTMNDTAYLYLSLMAFSVFMIHAATSGFGFMFIWPQNPMVSIFFFYGSFPLSIIFTVLFCVNFIQTEQYTPLVDRIMRILVVVLVPLTVLIYIVPFPIQKDLFLIIFVIDHLYYYPFIYSSLKAVRGGNRHGYFLLAALMFFILSQVEWVLTNLNIIPYRLVYFLNIKGMVFAIVMMAGLVYKFREMSETIAGYRIRISKAAGRLREKNVTEGTRLKIEQVKQFLRENFTEDISREGLASAVDMSPDHLGRIFKKETGVRISEFINTLRIEETKKMLENDDMKIIDIAFNTGFESLRTFNKVFQESERMTPSEYRKVNSV